jgi:hypothetical protein
MFGASQFCVLLLRDQSEDFKMKCAEWAGCRLGNISVGNKQANDWDELSTSQI